MKKLIPFSIALLLLSICTLSYSQQSKSKKQLAAEQSFIKQLNVMNARFPITDFNTDSILTVVQPFMLTDKGEVTVTWSANNRAGRFLIKKTIPLTAIQSIFYDDYVGFDGLEGKTIVSKSKPGSNDFTETYMDDLFHVAHVGDGTPEWSKKLQKALDNLRPYYPLDK